MDRTTGADWIDIGGGKRGFADRSTSGGERGTEVDADWLNGLQEELLAIIEAAGVEPDAEDRAQILAILRDAIQTGAWNYAEAAGTANALTAEIAPAPAALEPGLTILLKITTTNTAAATLNLNALGAKQIRRRDLAQLTAGQLPAGGLVQLTYDGTYWQMLPLLTSAGSGLPVLPYVAATGGGNALVADFDPPFTALSAGLAVEVMVAVTNTGAATINCNSLGAVAIERPDGSDLRPRDLVAGQVALLLYDGAVWQLATPRPPSGEIIYQWPAGGSTANAILVNPAPSFSAYQDGMVILVHIQANNTGPATLNVNGLGAKQVLNGQGAALQGGELCYGDIVMMAYKPDHFQVIGRRFPRREVVYAAAGGTANALTATPSPAVLDYTEGLMLMVRVTVDNTGAPTINVSGLGAKAIWHRYGAPLVAGELLAGEMALLVYDGTRFIHVNGARKRPGTPDWWTANTPPPGALERNGAAISRTTYDKLFAAIGTLGGPGDGVTTFNVPDDRGLFPRGWDNGRGYDAGRAFGSEQADEFKSHTHGIYEPLSQAALSAAAARTMTAVLTGTSGAAGGAETRPRNRAYLPIIWF